MRPQISSAPTGCSGNPVGDKPRHRSGYTDAETELVRSACLTVAVTLGAHPGTS